MSLGNIARRDMSRWKCHGIMCDQQDLSVEGQLLSSPAERHGLSPERPEQEACIDQMTVSTRGGNVTVPLYLLCNCQHLKCPLKYRFALMYTVKLCQQISFTHETHKTSCHTHTYSLQVCDCLLFPVGRLSFCLFLTSSTEQPSKY